MILLWFNPNNNSYYTRYYNSFLFFDYYVGYKNSYEHEVIKIFILDNNEIHNVRNYLSLNMNYKKKNNLLITFLKMLLNKLQTYK